jgi:hypothetical protein
MLLMKYFVFSGYTSGKHAMLGWHQVAEASGRRCIACHGGSALAGQLL